MSKITRVMSGRAGLKHSSASLLLLLTALGDEHGKVTWLREVGVHRGGRTAVLGTSLRS